MAFFGLQDHGQQFFDDFIEHGRGKFSGLYSFDDFLAVEITAIGAAGKRVRNERLHRRQLRRRAEISCQPRVSLR